MYCVEFQFEEEIINEIEGKRGEKTSRAEKLL